MEYAKPQFVNITKLQRLTSLWNGAIGIPLSIVNPDGLVLAKAGPQNICLHFCQLGTEHTGRCVRSDMGSTLKVVASRTYRVETCKNGFAQASMPITVLGEHMGNIVAGPFFLQSPDLKAFKQQAIQFGFDKRAYIDTVSRVPIVDKARLRAYLQGFSVFNEITSEAGLAKLAHPIDRKNREGRQSPHASGTFDKTGMATQEPSRQREKDKSDFAETIVANMKELIFPHVKKLRKSGLSLEQTSTMDVIETNLRKLISPIIGKMQTLGLTAREITVATFLSEGKTTNQIAELLGVSQKAVEFHRHNIRKKLGLSYKKTNLSSYLLSMH
jgi:DNA-binding CsgD family transcriptional regulator/ligand-binding sensor protein